MKKLLITASLLILTSIAVLPALANPYEGHNRMMGSEMGPWMMGPGIMQQGYYDAQRTPVDEEKIKAYKEEFAKHYKATADQRQDIVVKQHEMATLLVKKTTTKEELLEKQNELQGVMNGLQREELSFRWDMHKKYPEMNRDMYGGCLGPAAGYGGAGMRGYGPYGHGMMDRDDDRGRGMMDRDDDDDRGRGMMGTGRENRRK